MQIVLGAKPIHCIIYYNCYPLLKVALQIVGRKFYKITEKSSLYSQSRLIFIHKTPVVESHPTTRETRAITKRDHNPPPQQLLVTKQINVTGMQQKRA